MRTTRALAALVLPAALAALTGAAGARPAGTGGTTFKLVQTMGCLAPKRLVGLACYDSQGHDDWQVSTSAATTSIPGDTGWDVSEKYTIPEKIGPEGAKAELSVTVTDRDPAGAGGQVCIAGGFSSGDNCAHVEVPKGQTQTDEQTVTLTPYLAPEGTKATLLLALGDAGAMYYTYEAESASVAKATVLIGAHQLTDTFGELTLAASGTFTTTKRLSECGQTSCSLKLTPTGTFFGLQHDGDWRGFKDLRIKFKIDAARLDKDSGGGLSVDIQGIVISSTFAGDTGSPDTCHRGSQVSLYAKNGTSGVIHFGCGTILHSYHRSLVFKAVGTAISG